MKKFILTAAFLISLISNINAQNLPLIPELKSSNMIFKQYQEEVSANIRATAEVKNKNNELLPLNFYTYKATENDSFFTIAARCSIWQETISTINSISESGEKLTGKKLILPTQNGIFIPETQNTQIEILLFNEYENEIAEGLYENCKIGTKKFYFLRGKRFSPSIRSYFLNPAMILPIEKGIITSKYGNRKNPVTGNWRFHKGIDLAAPLKTPVSACKSGKIKKVGKKHVLYGTYVIISHKGGFESLYAHLNDATVTEGQEVSTGHVIGHVGITGQTTGPHLHFEIFQNGQNMDPALKVKIKN